MYDETSLSGMKSPSDDPQAITARHLREQLDQVVTALEQSPAATAITDAHGIITFVNRRFEAVTGYSRDESIGQALTALSDGNSERPTLAAGHEWRREGLSRRKNGEPYWSAETIAPVRDASGTTLYYVVVKEDISERKRQETQLRLMAIVFETGQAALITDAEMRIERVNQAFTDITGYAAEDVLGQTPRLFKSDRHDRTFYTDLWRTLLATGHWQGEIWNRNKAGEIYPVWQAITAVPDADGRIRHYVSVFHDISERKTLERELEAQASHDHLTGLDNRRAFDAALAREITAARRQDSPLHLLVFDIDHFKTINDTRGHETGDRLLCELGKTVRQCLRQKDRLARWGGDEFTILLPDTARDGAQRLAERVRAQIAASDFSGISITVSLGLTALLADDDAGRLFARADEALYRAKRDGRNRLVILDAPPPGAAPEPGHE
ncbi:MULTISPECIES: diguanylate cyclase [Modicisalibacter]|uniref:sensor domain-containing diguanylate cyclase n=1 Tax=Modicisalibacter TaxID=574347 RepID=UPI001CCD6073|nr:diguanylate cyclase [Halomonas coralii]